MYYLKNTLFLDLTKNQKASLFSFLKSFVKKHNDKSTDEILELFIEDEQYYYEVENPHFEWIVELFENDRFIKEIKTLINENKKQLKIKEAQKPYLEKQKQIAKEQRQKASMFKMSKEEPTKKQIYYYDRLCKQHNIEKENLDGKSRLDVKNMIGKILDDTQEPAKKGFDTDLYQ